MKFRPNTPDNIICPCSSDAPPYKTYYTRRHVLLDCPLYTEVRIEAFGHDPTLAHIFQTEEGGRRLGMFLHAFQAFLRPLPPRPDPS